MASDCITPVVSDSQDHGRGIKKISWQISGLHLIILWLGLATISVMLCEVFWFSHLPPENRMWYEVQLLRFWLVIGVIMSVIPIIMFFEISRFRRILSLRPRTINLMWYQLMESLVGPQNDLMKLLDESHLYLMAAVCSHLTTRSLGIAGMHSRVKMFLVLVGFMLRLIVKQLSIASPDKANSTTSKFVGLGAYIRTAAIVVEAYRLLLVTNIRYIRIAAVPIVILVFIGALHVKFRENHSSGNNREREARWRNDTESTKKVMKLVIVPYILLVFFALWTWLSRQQGGGIFVFSGFLLFLNSVLGALAVMIATSPAGVSPGAAQVLPVLHKTCITMLLITTHTMAAEWLGEDIIFACMPQLFALLVWFAVRFDHAGHDAVRAVNSLTLHKARLVFLSSILGIHLVSMDANDRKTLALWYKRSFCISFSSSALSYIHVWMLHQWPGSTSNSNGPIQLLKISANVSLCTTAIFFVSLVYFYFFGGN